MGCLLLVGECVCGSKLVLWQAYEVLDHASMPEGQVVAWIRDKYLAIVSDLDERGRRRWAAAEARSLGWGGVTAVAQATGLSDRTIRSGIQELDDPAALPAHRQRKPGGGRPAREAEQPKLLAALEALVEVVTRGDPQS